MNENGGLISATNNGIIDTAIGTSGAQAIYNGRSITTLTNSGILRAQAATGYAAGIWNDGILGSMTNTGTINATTDSGLAYGIINKGGLVSTLVNSGIGTIFGTTNGIYNTGTINSINNTGIISGGPNSAGSTDHGFYPGIDNGGTIGTITNNSGAFITGLRVGLANWSVITTLLNNGTVKGAEDVGLATFGVNFGNTIIRSSFQDITNNGLIWGLNGGVSNNDTISRLVNSGQIVGDKSVNADTGYGIYNGGYLGVFLNSGSVTGDLVGFQTGQSDPGPTSQINELVNTGTITGRQGPGLFNDAPARITTLTNQGTISGGTGSFGIKNQGTITTLNNAQNGLSYTGALPTNYNAILNSTASFARLVGTNVTGSTIFGVSNLSAWTPANYTFTGVLSGLTASNINSSSRTGNFGGYKWSLLLENGSTTIWDLKFESTAIGAGSTSSLSNGSGSSPITVAGGTLEATSNSTVTAPITLTGSSNSTINASGNSTVFSSAITSSGSGKLVLADSTGSGAVTFNSPNNVIAGGVALTSGTLAVGDGNNSNARLQADVALSPASTLKGHGTIVGLISNNGGTVRPGGSIGTLAVDGSYNQSSSSTLSIEINPTQNSLLSVYGNLGKANLGGTLDIVATAGTYAPKKYTMVTTTGGVVGSFSNVTNNLSSFSNLYSAVSYDAQNVYFTIYGFTLPDTQSSIVQTHSRLVNLFDYQTMMLSHSLGADCPIFDKNGGCVSISGRYSSSVSSSSSIASEVGALTAAFKLNDNLRVGAYVDQAVSEQTLYGIKVKNTLPTFGLFGVWAPTPGNAGLSLRASAALGSRNLDITRSTVGTSEAGMGSSGLVSKGAQAVVGYDVPIENGLTISPYLGARFSRQELGAYTETATTTVTAPLSYASLVLDQTTGIGGGRLGGKIDQSFGFFTDLGIEYDFRSVGGVLKTAVGDGLTPVAMGPIDKKIRPTASVGFYHDIAKNQRVSFSANYRMEQFQSTGSASTMLTYAVGFGEAKSSQFDDQVTNTLPSSQKSSGEVSDLNRGNPNLVTSPNDEKSGGEPKDNKHNVKGVPNSVNDAVRERSTLNNKKLVSQANLTLPIPRPAPTTAASVTATLDSEVARPLTAPPRPTPANPSSTNTAARPVAANPSIAEPAPKVAANSNDNKLPLPTPRPAPRIPSSIAVATDSTATISPSPVYPPKMTASLAANSNSGELTPPAPRLLDPTNPLPAITAARPVAAKLPIADPAPQMTASLAVSPKNIEPLDPEKKCIQQAEAVRNEHLKVMSALSSKGLGNYNRQTQK